MSGGARKRALARADPVFARTVSEAKDGAAIEGPLIRVVQGALQFLNYPMLATKVSGQGYGQDLLFSYPVRSERGGDVGDATLTLTLAQI